MSKESLATLGADEVLFAIKRLEGYEDVHPDLLAHDMFKDCAIYRVIETTPSETPCKATSYAPNGGASQEQRWHCEDCGDVTDTERCPKGRQNETLAKLASARTEMGARDAAFEEAERVALEQRCERGTPWDLACTTIATCIRALKGTTPSAIERKPVAWRYRLKGSSMPWRLENAETDCNMLASYEREPLFAAK
jgi:hypothetical protein